MDDHHARERPSAIRESQIRPAKGFDPHARSPTCLRPICRTTARNRHARQPLFLNDDCESKAEALHSAHELNRPLDGTHNNPFRYGRAVELPRPITAQNGGYGMLRVGWRSAAERDVGRAEVPCAELAGRLLLASSLSA